MHNVADGYAYIKAGDRSYELIPSFFNINDVGTPREIIEAFHNINAYQIAPVTAFSAALNVLECCGMDDVELTGSLTFSERKQKVLIKVGKMPPGDVIILAQHCLRHGVCGSNKQIEESREDDNVEPVREFNAYDYVVKAVETLGMTYTEAWGLTMTKYVNLMRSKIKGMEQRGEIKKTPSKSDVQALLKQREEIVKRRDAALAKQKAGSE